jgi:hypothetical protein
VHALGRGLHRHSLLHDLRLLRDGVR